MRNIKGCCKCNWNVEGVGKLKFPILFKFWDKIRVEENFIQINGLWHGQRGTCLFIVSFNILLHPLNIDCYLKSHPQTDRPCGLLLSAPSLLQFRNKPPPPSLGRLKVMILCYPGREKFNCGGGGIINCSGSSLFCQPWANQGKATHSPRFLCKNYCFVFRLYQPTDEHWMHNPTT